MIVEPQQFVFGHIAEHGGTDITDEIRVTFPATVVVSDDLEEIGLLREVVVAPRRAENRVERVDVLNVEPDLEAPADGLYRGVDLGEHLVFAFVEQSVPKDDFRILDEQPPELDEIEIGRASCRERV